jgi:PKD repeat protein
MPTNIVRPFYRDGKIRIGSYGKGVWESLLYEPQDHPVAKISVDKLEIKQHCENEPFYYVDHSMLNHYNATWEWTFEGGTPSTGNAWNEVVTYSSPGTYLTILTVTDENGQSDTDSLYITIEPYVSGTVLDEHFEGAFPPPNWEIYNSDSDITWEKSTAAGGFGSSSSSMVYRGYDYWPGGAEDDSRISMDLTSYTESELTFDVAYARYAVNYSDSLEVLVSTDCGANWNSLYFKGGSDLATVPDLGDFFVPAADEWRTDTVDLSAYDGLNDVWIAFRGHTGWGNNIYLDNINLGGVNHADVTTLEITGIEVYPTLIQCSEILHVKTPEFQPYQFELYSANGKLQLRTNLSGSKDHEIVLPELNSGMYHYVVRGATQIKTGKIAVVN